MVEKYNKKISINDRKMIKPLFLMKFFYRRDFYLLFRKFNEKN